MPTTREQLKELVAGIFADDHERTLDEVAEELMGAPRLIGTGARPVMQGYKLVAGEILLNLVSDRVLVQSPDGYYSENSSETPH